MRYSRTFRYICYTTSTSIMVAGNWAEPETFFRLLQTFALTTREEVSMT